MNNAYLEQLDAIDSGMDRINAEMRDAEKNLEGLEKCCGLCVLPWKRYKTCLFNHYLPNPEYFRTKNVEKSAAYSKTFKGNEDGKVNASGPRQIVSQNGMGPGSGYIQR
jgi:synaptosomal-associated protein 25